MSLIRLYIFAVFMSVLVVIPIAGVISNSNIYSFSLVKFSDYGGDEDKGEENHEDCSKDEKTEFQIITINNDNYVYSKKPLYQNYQKIISNFNIDIFIPPPEQA